MVRIRFALAWFALALCFAGCGGDEVCAEANDPVPAPNEAPFVAGPDEANGCDTPNPSTLSTSMVCLPGDPATGDCCGDVGWAHICRCGEWICPAGTVEAASCQTRCEAPGG